MKNRRSAAGRTCVLTRPELSVISKPECTGLLQYGHELAGDVHGHEPVEAPEEPATDEHRRQRDVAVDDPGELRLAFDIVHRWVDPEPLQQPLHDVAEAAPAPAHHQHGALRHGPPHLLPRRLLWSQPLVRRRRRRTGPRRPSGKRIEGKGGIEEEAKMIYRNWSLLSSTVVIWGGVATAGLAGIFVFGGKEKFQDYLCREGERLRQQDRAAMVLKLERKI